MSKNPFLPDRIDDYVTHVVSKETPVQQRLRQQTEKMPMARMLTAIDQVGFLGVLVKMIGAKRIIEVGTFTGYSALAMASALPSDGKLYACDMSKEWTDIGKPYWKEAGVDSRIELILAPAKDTLSSWLEQGKAGSFDMAFIDADKSAYDSYYELCLKLIRPGGVIAFDNMLWGGAVADPKENDEDTKALRALNLKLRDDARVDACMLTIADGIMLARKK